MDEGELPGKTCPRCAQWKPFSEFYRNRSQADGHGHYCKPCWRILNDASRQRHLEARQAKSRETAARVRADQPDVVRERQGRWYESKGLEYHRAYQSEHREQSRAANQRQRDQDPVHAAHLGNTYRVRREGADGHHTEEEWRALLAQYDNRCACCGKAKKLEHDHITPLALGGTDNIDNIQPLCHACNTRKGRRTLDYRPT